MAELDHMRGSGTWWKCKCDCGAEKVVYRGCLTSGDTISCGCYHREHNGEQSYKHGMAKTRLYRLWSGVVQRCMNPSADNYARYGGRGIKVCEEWRNDFRAFRDWSIANGYAEGLTIDRIDNEGNYEPSNCRWVNRTTQQNNTRRNHFFEYNGITHTVAEWSRILGVNHETLRYRIIRGNLKDFENLPYSQLITGETVEKCRE